MCWANGASLYFRENRKPGKWGKQDFFFFFFFLPPRPQDMLFALAHFRQPVHQFLDCSKQSLKPGFQTPPLINTHSGFGNKYLQIGVLPRDLLKRQILKACILRQCKSASKNGKIILVSKYIVGCQGVVQLVSLVVIFDRDDYLFLLSAYFFVCQF